VKPTVVNFSFDGDLAGFLVARDFQSVRRSIAYATMQGISQVSPWVKLGGPVAQQTTAYEEFVKSIQKPQSVGFFLGYKIGVDRAPHGRVPSQRQRFDASFPDAKPARGKNGELACAIVYFDNFYALRKTAP
jgi:hypothetical protein